MGPLLSKAAKNTQCKGYVSLELESPAVAKMPPLAPIQTIFFVTSTLLPHAYPLAL